MTYSFKNYIQYLTKKGIVKTQQIWSNADVFKTTFTVEGIDEDFFILSVFNSDNLKVSGLVFDNVVNFEMLAIINSNFFDINIIDEKTFFNSQSVIQLSVPAVKLDYQLTNSVTCSYNYFGQIIPLSLELLPDFAKNLYLHLIDGSTGSLSPRGFIQPVTQVFADSNLVTTSIGYFYGIVTAPVLATINASNYFYVPANVPFFCYMFKGTGLPANNNPDACAIGYSYNFNI